MSQIPQPTILNELRTGKLKQFGPVLSGIDKQCHDGPLYVSPMGLTDDEHDLTFHGGIDKAVHQYCSDNYPIWRSKYPEAAEKFVSGGFGENLVAQGFSEKNICAGDLVRVGILNSTATGGRDGCLLEVSLPRQPCFKLNQRFGLKNFAPVTHQLAMTGWYYRVKKEGWIAPGMEMRVVERPNPQWTIERLHHFVHREKSFVPVMQELIDMKVLGEECGEVFIKKKRKFEEDEEMRRTPPVAWRKFDILERVIDTPKVLVLKLNAKDAQPKPTPILPGSSVQLRLANGLKRSYSIVSGTEDCFVLGIARDANSRGGSVFLHDSAQIGEVIEVGKISQNLALDKMASHHIFIVGGIGITAFLAMMEKLQRINQTFELHDCVQNANPIAFATELAAYGKSVRTYAKSEGQRLDIEQTLKGRLWNSHVYVCGPQRMIDATLEAARKLDIPEEEVHYERFQIDATGDPFTCEVQGQSTCGSLQVQGQQSLLEVMRDAGLEVLSSCETGSCGTCRIPLLGGRVEHKGSSLTKDEREKEMLSCVSRGVGHIVVGMPEK